MAWDFKDIDFMQQRVKLQHGVALQRASTGSVRGGASAQVQSDGGFNQSGIKDDNNCTIRAFAIAYGMSYKDAHYMGELAGRPNGEGYWMWKIMEKAAEFGYEYKEYNGYDTLATFLKKNPIGRYICVRKGHAFAVINGKIYDVVPNPRQCKLIRIFKVNSKRIEYLKGFSCV
jgi:hypothetical protein